MAAIYDLFPSNAYGSLLYNLQFDPFTKSAFEQAKVKNTGKPWEKVLDYVLTYGDRAVSILSKNGIIANKNIQTILKAQYDQTALNELLAANAGALNQAPEKLVERSAAKDQILGMDTSTLLLIGGAVLLFMVAKK